MGFTLKVEGQIVDSEQKDVETKEGLISNAFRGVLAQFSNDITLAVATFDYAGEQDLTPTPSEPPPPPPPPADVFVTKVAGEDFAAYQARLFTWNAEHPDAQVPTDQQFGPDRQAEWEALPVG